MAKKKNVLAFSTAWVLRPAPDCTPELKKKIDDGLGAGWYYNSVEDAVSEIELLMLNEPDLFTSHQDIDVVQTITVFREDI